MLVSFPMIVPAKQDAVAEQQFAQRKVELDAREDALIERLNALDDQVSGLNQTVNALAGNEKSKANTSTISPDAQSQHVVPDPAEVEAERDRVIQQFRGLIPDPSQINSAKVEKDRITRERLTHRQGAQQQSQTGKQYKFRQAQKTWMAGATAPSDAEAAVSTTPSAADAISPTPSPSIEARSPTGSPAAEAASATPSPTPQ